MKSPIFIFTIILLLIVLSCNPIDRDLLTNNWKGLVVLAESQPVDMDPSQVRLEIREDGTYSYTDVIGKSQNGTFRTNKMGVLYLNPADGFEKAWTVKMLSSDSLVLKVEGVSQNFELVLISAD